MLGLGERRPGPVRHLGRRLARVRRAAGRSPRRSRGSRRAQARAPWRRSAAATRCISCASACGSSGARDRHQPVGGIDAAAGKHELARHELVPLHGACRAAPSARGPLRSTRISVAASFGRTYGMAEVALDLVHALHEAVHPFDRSAGLSLIGVASCRLRAPRVGAARARTLARGRVGRPALRAGHSGLRTEARSAARRRPAPPRRA